MDRLVPLGSDASNAARSERSLAFEAFWRAQPKAGLIPSRTEFRPERATRFLKNIILLKAQDIDCGPLIVRLAGSAIQFHIQREITGQDVLDYLAPVHRDGARESVRLVQTHPCGLWQVMALHYERGFSQKFELTIFPLRDPDGSPSMLLGLVMPLEEAVMSQPVQGKAMLVDTASAFCWLDIGAGAPRWPSQ
jgi:hypothetical protein